MFFSEKNDTEKKLKAEKRKLLLMRTEKIRIESKIIKISVQGKKRRKDGRII